ncbi:MAG: glycosyltransferase [Meiothermus sp.]|nr:glycosyltransferase [Meiothermus sp.]
MRILILSYFFPPYNTIGAVRVGKLAKYWHERGHEVRVISAENQLEPQTLALGIPQQQVTYCKWANLNFWVRLLSREKGDALSSATTDERQGLLSKLATLYRATVNFPDGKIGWYPYALDASNKLLEGWKPDVIYASAHPLTTLLVAERLASRHRIPWFAELRDLWTQNHYYTYGFPRRDLETRLERRTLSQASGLITVSEPLADSLRTFGLPTETILNGFDLEDYPKQTTPPNPKLQIIYTGIIYAGKRDPTPLFQALRQMGEQANEIEAHFYGRKLAMVEALAKAQGVAGSVHVHEAVPYQESLRLQKSADALLLLTWDHPSENGVYTGKLFEYIGASRPILTLGSQDSVAARLILSRGLGLTTTNPAQIAQWLTQLLEQKRSGGIPDLPASAQKGLSRVEQFERLDGFIAQQLGAKG